MNTENTRRLFFKNIFSQGIGVAAAMIGISSCQPETKTPVTPAKGVTDAEACNDYKKLDNADVKAREQLGYVQIAPSANKNCGNCKLWLPGNPCGKCQLFKGPVPPTAYCTYWAKQS
ncbi:MAG: hypothetical protein ABI687_05765 [Flavitalea sp.]